MKEKDELRESGRDDCMHIKEYGSIIEAILFTAGEALPLERIAKTLVLDEDTTKKILHYLMDTYAEPSRGVHIIELDGSYQMCTKAEMYEYIKRLVHQPKRYILTDALLETLSIIAYKQPVTKSELEHIRGVKSDHSVNKLIDYNLVCEVGRLDAPGRPLLFGTTEEFLRNFGMQSLKELPLVKSETLEKLKSEAEEEAQLKLNV